SRPGGAVPGRNRDGRPALAAAARIGHCRYAPGRCRRRCDESFRPGPRPARDSAPGRAPRSSGDTRARPTERVGNTLRRPRGYLAHDGGQKMLIISKQTPTHCNRWPQLGTQILGQAVTAEGLDEQGEAGQAIAVDLGGQRSIVTAYRLHLAALEIEP